MGMNCKMLKIESWIYLVCAVGALVTLVATMALRSRKQGSFKKDGGISRRFLCPRRLLVE